MDRLGVSHSTQHTQLWYSTQPSYWQRHTHWPKIKWLNVTHCPPLSWLQWWSGFGSTPMVLRGFRCVIVHWSALVLSFVEVLGLKPNLQFCRDSLQCWNWDKIRCQYCEPAAPWHFTVIVPAHGHTVYMLEPVRHICLHDNACKSRRAYNKGVRANYLYSN